MRSVPSSRSVAHSLSLVALVAATASCEVVQLSDTEAAVTQSGPEIEHLATAEQRALNLPFSEAVRVGDVLYLAGQMGTRPGTMELVDGGIQAETRQILENIKGVLERNGSSMDRIIRCLVMIDDIDQWGLLNEVYVEFFPGEKPARSAMGADGLALGGAVEIECTAAAGDGS